MAALDAVTFDFWNTLLVGNDPRWARQRHESLLHVLARAGVRADPDRLRAAQAAAISTFNDHWQRNEVFGAADAVDHLLADQDLVVEAAVRDELVRCFTDPPADHDPDPTPNIGDALEALKSAGVRIGIICDVGLTPSRSLRRMLERHGLLGYFDHWSFSDEVGTFKPDPAIFGHALTGLGGVDPERAAHVGDLRRTDIAGANAVGLTSVRYHGVHDDPGSPEEGTSDVEGAIVLGDHADLPSALGIDR